MANKYLRSLLFFATPVLALVAGPAVAQTARQKQVTTYTINDDLSVEMIQTLEATPLTSALVQGLSQLRLPVNGNQTLDILEAYTRKKDGRIVRLSPSDVVTQDGAVGPLVTLIDMKIRQLNFPDVEVGDTLVARLRVFEKDHYFPGHFSTLISWGPNSIEREGEIVLSHPANLPMATSHSQFDHQETRTGDRIEHRWTGKALISAVSETNPANVIKRSPYITFSTLTTYEDIGRIYARGAQDRSRPDAALIKLADEITYGVTDRREQARALFDWITRNIRYVAVYIGNGRFVPNDVATILSRRYGDCKDHAALFASLLAAKGIESEHVLINTLPNFDEMAPTLQAFNHAILYLPEFDLFADPTAPHSTLDTLPFTDAGKLVVVATPDRARVTRTPVSNGDISQARIESRMKLAADGTLSGETVARAQGQFAQVFRNFIANAEGKEAATVLEPYARSAALIGTYTLSGDKASDHRQPFEVRTSWIASKKVNLKATWSVPPGIAPVSAVASQFVPTSPARRIYEVQCRPGRIEQISEVELPKNLRPASLPGKFQKTIEGLSVLKEWSMKDDRLHVATTMSFAPDSHICSPQQIAAIVEGLTATNSAFNGTLRLAEPAAQPRNPTARAAQGEREMTLSRTVRADARSRIGLSYALDPDCRSDGVPISNILKAPQNGKFESVVEDGYSNYPRSDGRFRCNDEKRQVEAFYFRPNPGFSGEDSVTVETHFPSGNVSRREFRIQVR